MTVDPRAGQLPDPSMLANIPRLVSAYYTQHPDPARREERVAFGTSGHRGTSLTAAFTESHILATTQAICQYRREQQIDGPVFLGIDTHALSESAFGSALEVLAANGVDAMIDIRDGYTPTPAVSHAILGYNAGRSSGLADGIVITPSHNPPDDGGFKYNGTNGGPADTKATGWIEQRANALLADGLREVKRIPLARARTADTTHRFDYADSYVADLPSVVDLDVLRGSSLRLGVDPLGGAGVAYWGLIAERHRIPLTVVSDAVDPTFRFMTVDWDGRIRMDCSSSYAMQRLIALRDQFDVAWACDPDHDRHGIVARSAGLLNPNHYLAVAIEYLFQRRAGWSATAGIGKTVVSSSMIDRVALMLGLLAAEMTAVTGRDPGELYAALTERFGAPAYERIDAPATPEQKSVLARLTPERVRASELAGEPIVARLTAAPGNGAPIGGLKVVTENGWFAARPSGTENVYKLYAESFNGTEHLRRIQDEARQIISDAFAAG